MNCLPKFIDLARFKLYGFIANTAEREMRRLRGSHGTASKHRIIRLHKRPATQNGVRAEGCVRDL